jgi:hypothetical protein
MEIEKSLRYAAPEASIEVEFESAEAVSMRLEFLNDAIKESLRYIAPEAPEASIEVETESADATSLRLEFLNDAVEESIKYKAPEVSEDIREYEIEVAMERLENHFLAVEESIKF